MNLEAFSQLIRSHAWLALAVLVTSYLARLTRDDSRFPVTVPEQWHPVVVVFFGTLAEALQRVHEGAHWTEAVSPAIVIAFGALALKALYHDHAEPAWLQWLAAVVPPLAEEKEEIEVDPETSHETSDDNKGAPHDESHG